MKSETKDIKLFLFAFTIILSLISIKLFVVHKINAYYSILFLAVMLFIISITKPLILKPFYIFWNVVARTISAIITSFVLISIFYLVVTPIGLFLNIVGKDLLELKKKSPNSYWHKKEEIFSKESYLKQF